ncbi:hypothetical protein [Haloferax volcanii]|uniref:hypothetical protein n=1 Tax=Haloferax volcanii TaxID=2246 RepID=UPI003D30191D
MPLHTILSEHLENRDYSESTLEALDDYPKLKSHFHQSLLKKIDNETYHPMLRLLDRDVTRYLNLFENNWELIPGEKRQQLLGSAFESTLSEIVLILQLEKQGLDFDVDVNLHKYPSGDLTDKDVDIVVDGNYIEIRTPQTWRNLEVANCAIGLPNRAYDQISDKFKSDYAGSIELTQEPVFIALDLTESEIQPEEVISSFYGSLKGQLLYDKESGEVVDKRTIRDPEDSLQGWRLLDDHLNGVVWYTSRLKPADDSLEHLEVDGDVVPNPHHHDEGNRDFCLALSQSLFDT